MIARFLALLLVLLPLSAAAQNSCLIEMALGEQLGPPDDTQQIVSVIPYDANGTGYGLRICWAAEADKDKLATSFQSAPPGVTCSAADTAWAAVERVDLTMTSLSAGTRYWYKVQCDSDTGASFWTDRNVYTFSTIPAAGSDTDYMFEVESDPHYGQHFVTTDSGYCERHESGRPGGVPGEAAGWKNMNIAIHEMAKARGLFHVNVGDYYQTDGKSAANSCPKSELYSPARGTGITIGNSAIVQDGEYVDQRPGFPTRGEAGTTTRGIQLTATDSQVKVRAKWMIWKIHQRYQQIFAESPFVFAWGNHDNPRWPASISTGDCAAGFPDDGQGTPKKPWENMRDAWQEIVYKPTTTYPNSETDCDNPTPVGSCDNDGYYYTFSAGLAQYWIINPFEEAGGHGTPSSTKWDGTRQFPETAADWSLGQIQYQWLASTVAASNAKWKIIFTHHPVGGLDTYDPGTAGCYWYARGSLLTTAGRYCDMDGDTLGGPNDSPNDGGKSCNTDDASEDGFAESSDDRPSGWVSANGACPTGKPCLPTPYNNRFATMAGDATYGQQAIQALLKGNLDSGGANFIFLGHDHLTAGGCKNDSDGCSDVWYITGGQPTGDGDGANAPPLWAQDGKFSQYFDFNGDTIPDFRTDGSPYPTPVDREALTLRKGGSQLRGFYKVNVSSEGVRIDHQSVESTNFLGDFGKNVVTYLIGAQATTENDFDGSGALDSESKRSGETVTIAGNVDCDFATSPAPLEGTQSCRLPAPSGVQSTATRDAAWTDTASITCEDFLFAVENADTTNVADINFAGFRDDATSVTGVLRLDQNQANCAGGTGTACFYPATRASGGTTGTKCAGMAAGTTYQVRFCYDPTADDAHLWMDACDPDDDNCDGELDVAGTAVTPPTWGTGAFCDSLANGSSATAQTDGWRFGTTAATTGSMLVDALGICVGWNPGEFKCGDNFE